MLISLFYLVGGTLVLTALLTPFAATAIEYLIPTADYPFSRIFDRVAIIAILVMLYLLRGRFSVRATAGQLVEGVGIRALRHVAAGALLSFGLAAACFPLMVNDGLLVWQFPSQQVALEKALKIVPAALAIAAIEEPFFRLLLLNQIRRRSSTLLAVAATSALYAVVHFIVPQKRFGYEQFDPLAGFVYLYEVLRAPLIAEFASGFFGLFLAGVILAMVMLRTGSLALCIGIHSGWIVASKFSLVVTHSLAASNRGNDLVRRFFLVSNPVSWLAIVLVLLAIYFVWRGRAGGVDEIAVCDRK